METRADGLLLQKGRTQPRRPEQITTESQRLMSCLYFHVLMLHVCSLGLACEPGRMGSSVHSVPMHRERGM
ncbi:hypothetical protein NDU88_000129 [Pleurodeles waltl]|uniref:Uncharacterized protein n=1 Tax=Pleurodeles waltl TaxID=8319 RepID=A0AAV7UP40_PLEWA|nr:hypothetical protein NDU88_000129 [Pleurodeles waltl]